jgi:hypothetical protein
MMFQATVLRQRDDCPMSVPREFSASKRSLAIVDAARHISLPAARRDRRAKARVARETNSRRSAHDPGGRICLYLWLWKSYRLLMPETDSRSSSRT